MRNLSPAFAEHLAGGVTTLARCWRVVRRDGVSLGFTDHDGDLVFNGVTFARDRASMARRPTPRGPRGRRQRDFRRLDVRRAHEADFANGV